MTSSLQAILSTGSLEEKKALFCFSWEDADEAVLLKFNLWARHLFPQYFTSKDAAFHKEIDENNLKIYRGKLDAFVDIAFRGAAKTARTKLFLAFCIANDTDHFRRFLKVLCADLDNSKQIVTDIFNILISPGVAELYAEIFQKTSAKREETMSSFTTSTSVKVVADSVYTDQRGALQEDSRPDLILFEDFETRKTLRSGRTTKAIRDNMEEARTGLAKGGGSIYNCNYLSEAGNVHLLVQKQGERRKVLIVPIVKHGVLAWPDRFSHVDIEQMRKDDDDFEGERLCKPSATKDVIFDRETLDNAEPKEPIENIAGFKIFTKFNPSHRYGSGHDVAGGVGLDSSTSTFIDFSVNPNQVAATFASNTMRPEDFGDEIHREGKEFANPISGIEINNHGHATVARCKQLGVRLYQRQAKETQINESTPREYGWHTNAATKPQMIFDLVKAVNDGHLKLNDPDLIAECRSYTRNDLIDSQPDPRLTTRHFDKLISAAIAWQMKDFAEDPKAIDEQEQEQRRMMQQNRSRSILTR